MGSAPSLPRHEARASSKYGRTGSLQHESRDATMGVSLMWLVRLYLSSEHVPTVQALTEGCIASSTCLAAGPVPHHVCRIVPPEYTGPAGVLVCQSWNTPWKPFMKSLLGHFGLDLKDAANAVSTPGISGVHATSCSATAHVQDILRSTFIWVDFLCLPLQAQGHGALDPTAGKGTSPFAPPLTVLQRSLSGHIGPSPTVLLILDPHAAALRQPHNLLAIACAVSAAASSTGSAPPQVATARGNAPWPLADHAAETSRCPSLQLALAACVLPLEWPGLAQALRYASLDADVIEQQLRQKLPAAARDALKASIDILLQAAPRGILQAPAAPAPATTAAAAAVAGNAPPLRNSSHASRCWAAVNALRASMLQAARGAHEVRQPSLQRCERAPGPSARYRAASADGSAPQLHIPDTTEDTVAASPPSFDVARRGLSLPAHKLTYQLDAIPVVSQPAAAATARQQQQQPQCRPVLQGRAPQPSWSSSDSGDGSGAWPASPLPEERQEAYARQPDVRSTLESTYLYACLLEAGGHFRVAQEVLSVCEFAVVARYGARSRHLAALWQHMGALAEQQGCATAAEALARQSLEQMEVAHGPEHPARQAAQLRYAQALRRLQDCGGCNGGGSAAAAGSRAGQPPCAEALVRSALVAADAAHGPASAEALAAMRALCRHLAACERYEEAEVVLQSLLAVQGVPTVAPGGGGVGAKPAHAGDPDAVRSACAWTEDCAMLGDDVVELRRSAGDGGTYHNAHYDGIGADAEGGCSGGSCISSAHVKRLQDVQELYAGAIAAAERVLGACHTAAAELRLRRAQQLVAAGWAEEGEAEARAAFDAAAVGLPPSDPWLLVGRAMLARVLVTRGSLDAAEAVLQEGALLGQALVDHGTLLAADQRRLALLDAMAALAQRRSCRAAAVSLLRETLPLASEQLGDQHALVMQRWVDLGLLLMADDDEPVGDRPASAVAATPSGSSSGTRDLRGAEAALSTAADISMRCHGRGSAATKAVCRHLQHCYELQGRLSDAEMLGIMYRLGQGNGGGALAARALAAAP